MQVKVVADLYINYYFIYYTIVTFSTKVPSGFSH